MHTTEMRMSRWASGKTRLHHVRNVDIWKEAYIYPMAEFLREKRLIWFGHVQRRDKDDATRKIVQMTVDGKRNRGRPNLRRRDLVKEDTARNQMTSEMAEDRKHWHVENRNRGLYAVDAIIFVNTLCFFTSPFGKPCLLVSENDVFYCICMHLT